MHSRRLGGAIRDAPTRHRHTCVRADSAPSRRALAPTRPEPTCDLPPVARRRHRPTIERWTCIPRAAWRCSWLSWWRAAWGASASVASGARSAGPPTVSSSPPGPPSAGPLRASDRAHRPGRPPAGAAFPLPARGGLVRPGRGLPPGLRPGARRGLPVARGRAPARGDPARSGPGPGAAPGRGGAELGGAAARRRGLSPGHRVRRCRASPSRAGPAAPPPRTGRPRASTADGRSRTA